eukprot:839591-Alexandrium_andersonii.AAC.1
MGSEEPERETSFERARAPAPGLRPKSLRSHAAAKAEGEVEDVEQRAQPPAGKDLRTQRVRPEGVEMAVASGSPGAARSRGLR